jgi:hypothetical protein
MATITERPYKYSFSENEIRYVLTVADPEVEGLEVQFEIYTHSIGEVAAKFVSFSLYAPPDGIIYCHIRSYLKSLLLPTLPDPAGAVVQPARSQLQYFYIRYREVTTADPNADWIDDIGHKSLVVLGGVEQIKFSNNDFIEAYIELNKAFLTWVPQAKRYVFANQLHYLSFLVAFNSPELTVHIDMRYTDGSTAEKDIVYTNNDGQLLFHVNTGVIGLQLSALQPTKKIWYYEVSVFAKTTFLVQQILIANAYRFYIDYRQFYYYNDFVYLNSLGGWDSLRLKGEREYTVDTSSTDVEHVIYKDAVDTTTPQRQFSQVNVFKTDKYKADAGYQPSRGQQEAIIELLVSGHIYELIHGRWIGIQNLKKSTDINAASDKKWGLAVEWSYAYTDNSFTPKALTWNTITPPQVGDPINPACIGVPRPVSVNVSIASQVEGEIVVYHVSWTWIGSYSGQQVNIYVRPNGGDWLAAPYATGYTQDGNNRYYHLGMTDHVAHQVKVEVVCDGDTSVVRLGFGSIA